MGVNNAPEEEQKVTEQALAGQEIKHLKSSLVFGDSESEKEDKEKELNISQRSIKSSQGGRICRICFDETEEKENPLISPCKCSGTMEFVHFKCLRQWRSRGENKKIAPHVTTYTWKAFHCELCKQKLQDQYEVNGRNYQIFEI